MTKSALAIFTVFAASFATFSAFASEGAYSGSKYASPEASGQNNGTSYDGSGARDSSESRDRLPSDSGNTAPRAEGANPWSDGQAPTRSAPRPARSSDYAAPSSSRESAVPQDPNLRNPANGAGTTGQPAPTDSAPYPNGTPVP